MTRPGHCAYLKGSIFKDSDVCSLGVVFLFICLTRENHIKLKKSLSCHKFRGGNIRAMVSCWLPAALFTEVNWCKLWELTGISAGVICCLRSCSGFGDHAWSEMFWGQLKAVGRKVFWGWREGVCGGEEPGGGGWERTTLGSRCCSALLSTSLEFCLLRAWSKTL